MQRKHVEKFKVYTKNLFLSIYFIKLNINKISPLYQNQTPPNKLNFSKIIFYTIISILIIILIIILSFLVLTLYYKLSNSQKLTSTTPSKPKLVKNHFTNEQLEDTFYNENLPTTKSSQLTSSNTEQMFNKVDKIDNCAAKKFLNFNINKQSYLAIAEPAFNQVKIYQYKNLKFEKIQILKNLVSENGDNRKIDMKILPTICKNIPCTFLIIRSKTKTNQKSDQISFYKFDNLKLQFIKDLSKHTTAMKKRSNSKYFKENVISSFTHKILVNLNELDTNHFIERSNAEKIQDNFGIVECNIKNSKMTVLVDGQNLKLDEILGNEELVYCQNFNIKVIRFD